MQEINRLKQLRDQILGIEMHLDLVKADLGAVDRDIEFLENLAVVLKENIAVLKQDGIIAIASEYRKSVGELKTANTNLEYYFNMKVRLNRDYERHIKLRDDSLLEFEELKKRIESRKVILLFDQSKRKK